MPVPCPGCAVETARVRAWCGRTVADVPVDGRRVMVNVRVRRLACQDWRCPRQTFREQFPGSGCVTRDEQSAWPSRSGRRIDKPEKMRRAPQYRPALVDPNRGYLRNRRAEDPAVPVLQLLREIRERGYTGSQNLLYRYITQGRVEDDRPAVSPAGSPDCCSPARRSRARPADRVVAGPVPAACRSVVMAPGMAHLVHGQHDELLQADPRARPLRLRGHRPM
ncbi:transposase family protein [Actinoallomurus acanthiterrae]